MIAKEDTLPVRTQCAIAVYCKLRIPQVAKRIPHFCRENSPEMQKAIADPWVGRLLSW